MIGGMERGYMEMERGMKEKNRQATLRALNEFVKIEFESFYGFLPSNNVRGNNIPFPSFMSLLC